MKIFLSLLMVRLPVSMSPLSLARERTLSAYAANLVEAVISSHGTLGRDEKTGRARPGAHHATPDHPLRRTYHRPRSNHGSRNPQADQGYPEPVRVEGGKYSPGSASSTNGDRGPFRGPTTCGNRLDNIEISCLSFSTAFFCLLQD